MIQVLGIAYGTGGSEIMEVLRASQGGTGVDIEIVATSRLAKEKVNTNLEANGVQEILEVVRLIRPDIILLETSNEKGYEEMEQVIRYCREQEIFTVSLLDVAGGYDRRFREEPDLIIAPNSKTAREVNLQVFSSVVLIEGNPTFDGLRQVGGKEPETIPRVLFVSQPDGNGKNEFYCKMLIHWLDTVVEDGVLEGYQLDVKAHPRETKKDREYWQRIDNCNLLDWDDNKDFTREMEKWDILAGRNSTVMLKASKMGMNVIYLDDLFRKEVCSYLNGEVLGKEFSNEMSEENSTELIFSILRNI